VVLGGRRERRKPKLDAWFHRSPCVDEWGRGGKRGIRRRRRWDLYAWLGDDRVSASVLRLSIGKKSSGFWCMRASFHSRGVPGGMLVMFFFFDSTSEQGFQRLRKSTFFVLEALPVRSRIFVTMLYRRVGLESKFRSSTSHPHDSFRLTRPEADSYLVLWESCLV
jgi:hypothetical protein